MALESFRYAPGMAPYSADVEAVGREFMRRLFAVRPAGMTESLTAETHPLAKVTHPDFKEYLMGDDGKLHLTLQGLQKLVEYRGQFREPTLLSIGMIAVPQAIVPEVPGTNGLRYSFNTMEDSAFLGGRATEEYPEWWHRAHEAPGARQPGVTDPALHVRMIESLDVRWDPERGRYMVYGRTYTPVGEDGLLRPGGQHEFIGGQARHWHEHHEEKSLVPIEDIYEATFGTSPGEPRWQELQANYL